MELFCQDFKQTLEDMITRGIADRGQTDLEEELHTEVVQQATFAQEKCKVFHGRQKFLDVLKRKVTGSEHVYVSLSKLSFWTAIQPQTTATRLVVIFGRAASTCRVTNVNHIAVPSM